MLDAVHFNVREIWGGNIKNCAECRAWDVLFFLFTLAVDRVNWQQNTVNNLV